MSKFRSHHHGTPDDGDRDDVPAPPIDPGTLGLGRSLTHFIRLIDAVLTHPVQDHLAAGYNGATAADSKLFWLYDPLQGLRVKAAPGLLTTQTGNGGFNLKVGLDGSWSLKFDGTDKVIGHKTGDDEHGGSTVPPPAADLMPVTVSGPGPNGAGRASYNGANDIPELITGNAAGWDTFQGGVGDYMIGGGATPSAGPASNGNCAIYTLSPGAVLVDMQNGFGYGGNAEGNVYVNMNQARGSLYSDVLIGNVNGTDLKSGGDNALMISTGGDGFELRPDGRGNVMVSTVGADRLAFDATHGWLLGDDNIMLGFNLDHGDVIDMRALTNGTLMGIRDSASKIASDFHAPGTHDIGDYVRIDDMADGSHVIFSPNGDVAHGGYDIANLKFVHGLDAGQMFGTSLLA